MVGAVGTTTFGVGKYTIVGAIGTTTTVGGLTGAADIGAPVVGARVAGAAVIGALVIGALEAGAGVTYVRLVGSIVGLYVIGGEVGCLVG